MELEKLIKQSVIWRGLYFVTLLLLNVSISRTLGAAASGQLYFFTNFFSLPLLLLSFNMESGFTYFVSSNTIKGTALACFGLLWTVFSGAVLHFLTPFIFHYVSTLPISFPTGYAGLYAIGYVCGLMGINFITVIYYARGNFFLPNLILSLLNLSLVVIFIFAQGVNVKISFYFLSFIVQMLCLSLFFFIQKGLGKTFLLPSLSEVSQLFRYSAGSLAANLVFFFVYKIDYWFVQHQCTPLELGNYIQASKMGQLLLVVPQIVASAIFPQTASLEAGKGNESEIYLLFRLMAQVFGVLLLVIYFVGNPFFQFVFGHDFYMMQAPLLFLLPGILGLGMLGILSAYFAGKDMVYINVKGAVLGLAVVVAGNLCLVPLYGINGAAIGSSLGYMANVGYALCHFNKFLAPYGWKKLLLFSKRDWQWAINVFLKKG